MESMGCIMSWIVVTYCDFVRELIMQVIDLLNMFLNICAFMFDLYFCYWIVGNHAFLSSCCLVVTCDYSLFFINFFYSYVIIYLSTSMTRGLQGVNICWFQKEQFWPLVCLIKWSTHKKIWVTLENHLCPILKVPI